VVRPMECLMPCLQTPPGRARALPRLRDESGIALVMALGIMLVLTIALSATIVFTSESARHANGSNAGQKAYSIAEAGLNDAISQLAVNYPPYKTPIANDGDTGGTISSGGPKAFTGGTVSWSGTFNSGTNTWALTGTGTVKNPTGPNPTGNNDIVRTAKASVPVTPGVPFFYKYGFFMGDPNPPSCSLINNSGGVSLAVYVAGCLTFSGAATIVEPPPGTPPTLDMYVGGLLNMGDKGSAKVGTATNPIRSATLLGGCQWHGNPTTCNNGTSSQVYAASYPTTAIVQPMPTVDPATIYARANWSAATCTSGTEPFDNNATRNSSKGNVDLLGLAKFDCTAKDGSGNTIGRLAWDPSTKTLTASGTIFIDGNLTIGSNRHALYTAGTSATIYVNGTVSFSNDGSICGPGSGSTASSPCLDKWDPNQGELLLWALNTANKVPGFTAGGNAYFEGGAAVNGQYLGSNGAKVKGPVIANYGEIDGDGKQKAFITVPGGAPGGGTSLGAPFNYG
jgi:hypothetical protein